MKNEILKAVLVIFFVFAPSVCICQTVQIGKESLEIAEHHQVFAEFEKALTWCDKAISALNREIQQAGVERSVLARAHYLKAFVLVSLGRPEKEIELELLRALLADSEYNPPESYISHPTIKKLLPTARAKFQEKVNQAFELGMTLFAEEKYCEAKDILAPIARIHENAELAMTILKKCESKCQPPPPEEEPSEPLDDEEKQVEEPPPVNPLTLLVFPVTSDDSDKGLCKYVEPEKLAQILASYAPDFEISAVGKEEAETWKQQIQIEGFHEFIVEKGRIYMDDSREKLGDGIFIDMLFNSSNMGPVTVGGLIPRLTKSMQKLFTLAKSQYLLFLKVEKTEFGGNPKLDLKWCIYSRDNPQTPVDMGQLRYLNLIKSKSRYKKIGHSFQNYLKEQI